MSSNDTITLRAYAAVGGAVCALAFSGIFVSWANAPGAVTGFYRAIIAVVVLAIPFYRRAAQNGYVRSPMRWDLPRREVYVALLGGLFFGLDMALYNTGVLLSGAVNPTLMGNTAPIWVGLGAYFLFRERLRAPFWGGLVLAFAGAALIMGIDALQELSLGWGTFLGLVAGMFYGAYFLTTQRGRERLDALTYFWIAGCSSAMVLLVLALLFQQPLIGYSTRTYLSFLGLGLVSQALGQLLFNYALGHLPASIVAPLALMQPVITAILAIPLLGEGISIWQVVGGTAVLTGIFIVQQSRQQVRGKAHVKV